MKKMYICLDTVYVSSTKGDVFSKVNIGNYIQQGGSIEQCNINS